MRRSPHVLLAIVGALCGGCKTVPELASDGRWLDACERAWKHGDAERGQLWAIQHDALTTEISVHVYETDALEELLPYVPAQMASGEVVLVEFALRGSPTPASTLTVSPALYSGDERWGAVDCCDEQGWLVLDGREDEWLRLEAAREEAARKAARRDARRKRFPVLGTWDLLGALGGMLAATLADALWLGTLGEADLDLRGSVPGAHWSVGGMTRDIVDAASVVVDRIEADADGPPLDALSRPKLQAAVALAALASGGPSCRVNAEVTTCTSTWLARTQPAPDTLALSIFVGWEETDRRGDWESCSVDSEQRVRLPSPTSASAPASGSLPWTRLRALSD